MGAKSGDFAQHPTNTILVFEKTSGSGSSEMRDVISAGVGSFGAVNIVGSGSYGSSMFNDGARILAFLPNAGPAGEEHAVEITSVNSNGTFNYFDPTTGNTVTGSSATVGYMFSIQCQ